MANVTFTIPNPVLSGTEKFKTRYRKLPNGSFTAYVDRTNTPFTINGLDDSAQYVLEIVFVKEDGTECPATYEFFDTEIAGDCVTINGQIICENNLAFLILTYTFPSPYTIPPCGYKITLTQGSTTIVIDKPLGLNIGGQETISLPNANSWTVRVQKNLCSGILRDCYFVSLFGVECGCDPLVITSTSISFNPLNPSPWRITINFIDSNPQTMFTRISFNQTNTVTSGALDSGFIVLPTTPIGIGASTAWSITFPVSPNMNGAFETPSYKGIVFDACDTPVPFTI